MVKTNNLWTTNSWWILEYEKDADGKVMIRELSLAKRKHTMEPTYHKSKEPVSKETYGKIVIA